MAVDTGTGTVFYLDREPYKNEKPYFCCLPPEVLKGNPQTNHIHLPVDIVATNIRDDISAFSLDKNGFEVANQKLGDGFSYDTVKTGTDAEKRYIETMESFLAERLQAKKVVIFDVETRKRNPEFPGSSGEKSSLEQPVRGVHVDSSPAAAVERAVYVARENKCEDLLDGRMQIVNAWRPFFSDLQDWPLGLCDWQSVDVNNDLTPSDTVFPNNVAETLQVHAAPAHKWYFLDKQSKDEVLLFKIFDSDESSSRVCPHAAFQPKLRGYGSSRPRESIETRAMVFYG